MKTLLILLTVVTTTLYHPVKNQCSGNPLVTADGSKINLGHLKEGKIRWLAISRDLRRHYKFGDTIMVISDHKVYSGKWVVHDVMGPKHKMSIDFLVHPSYKSVPPRRVKIYKHKGESS